MPEIHTVNFFMAEMGQSSQISLGPSVMSREQDARPGHL